MQAGSLLDASAHLYRTATRRVGRNRKCQGICETTAGWRRATTAWRHDPPHLLRLWALNRGAAMARLFSNRGRPVDLGVLPTERLPRDAQAASVAARQPGDLSVAGSDSVAGVVPAYRQLFAGFLDGAMAPARAPVPDDPEIGRASCRERV